MRVTVHLPKDTAQALQAAARNERVSVSRLVAEAVRWYLGERRRLALGRAVLARVGAARVDPAALEVLEADRRDGRP